MICFNQINPILNFRISNNIRELTLGDITDSKFLHRIGFVDDTIFIVRISTIEYLCTKSKTRQKFLNNLLLNLIMFSVF